MDRKTVVGAWSSHVDKNMEAISAILKLLMDKIEVYLHRGFQTDDVFVESNEVFNTGEKSHIQEVIEKVRLSAGDLERIAGDRFRVYCEEYLDIPKGPAKALLPGAIETMNIARKMESIGRVVLILAAELDECACSTIITITEKDYTLKYASKLNRLGKRLGENAQAIRSSWLDSHAFG